MDKVIYANMRESGDDDWIDIECRFANGEKYSAIKVDAMKPELAYKVAKWLSRYPDKNCITLPDGSCVGEDCMHD